MKSRTMTGDNGTRTFVIALEPGEEMLPTLTAFADDNSVSGASLTAIGAFKEANVSWFDFKTKDYRRIPVQSQNEVLGAIDDVAEYEVGNPGLHIHVVVGLSDGFTRGGHLLDGIVTPALEAILVETPKDLRRRRRLDLGIPVIDLDLTTFGSAPS